MNGGAGERFWVRVPTLVTFGWSRRDRGAMALGGRLVADVERRAVDPHDLGREALAGGRGEERLDRPVLAGA